MTALVGLMLGGGLMLVLSPGLWPRGEGRGIRPPQLASVRERLVQAGLHRVSPAVVVVVSALLGVVGFAVVLALTGVVVVATAAGILAATGPALAIGWRARTRRQATRVVWPDLVDQLVSSVRAGSSLPDAMVGLAGVGPDLTRSAFAELAFTYRTTGNFALALDELKARLADPVADRIVETVRMSREVGGTELTTVLRNLSGYLRQEAAIRSEVLARQSWVVNAARLGVAAPWVVLLLLATRPEAAAAYNSPAGVVLIVSGLLVSVIAYRLMIRLGRMPEERRWFA
ncbi:MAG TPA: type II secretion system F family protein [Rhodoglobus sp.]|nr:type II secretion system F family protein [Rhodoglobus sp.]